MESLSEYFLFNGTLKHIVNKRVRLQCKMYIHVIKYQETEIVTQRKNGHIKLPKVEKNMHADSRWLLK